ncbi:MAG: PQQ-dependent sugar dehydrogenase [Candidatus Gracilibacteria bacterium]|nr:PQQ-dependent sugar dehydrogenase [Candidatus Peregrinibacteria bacterium]
MKKVSIGVLAVSLLVLVGGYYAFGYLGFWAVDYLEPGEEVILDREGQPVEVIHEDEIVDYEVEVFAENLFVPWSIVFTDSNRVLVTERNGSLRIIQNGILLDEPLHTFSEVSLGGEEGLMGLALDPQYQQNKMIYLSYAYTQNGKMWVKVVRFVDEGDQLSNEEVLLDKIPAAQYHAGSRLRFGPDGKLYVTTGDATQKELAQNMDSLAGKILRMNRDGSIPDDNPFEDSYVYSLGHRNPQGIDWFPGSDVMYSTEHGPSVFDGPAGGDEVNVIVAGGNYGWPRVSHERNEEGLIAPEIVYTPAVAPGSGMFYTSEVFPQFQGDFFFGMLKGEGIMRVRVQNDDFSEVLLYEELEGINFGRIRDVAQGPDGFIYFSTSNMDGRGNVQSGDDKILRLIPKK